MVNFEEAIASRDLSLYKAIESQSTIEDKHSLLACQLAVRELLPDGYRYLEIGSHLGGSIQPHLLDPRCKAIVSIDKRPQKQPDERGFDYTYLNNSTERMLENLRALDADAVEKIMTIDGGTDEISPEQVGEPVDLCLIDGEHTDAAMKRDFDFCRKVLSPAGGAIMFHDAQITYNGIYDAIEDLKRDGVPFKAYNLPHVVFVIEIGEFPIHRHPAVNELLVNNYAGYLHSLRENDRYRRFANRYPFRVARNFYARIKNGNTSR